MHGNFTNIPIDMGSEWLNHHTTLSRTLINGGYLKGIDTEWVSHFAPFFDSPIYLQTIVAEKEENNNAAAILKTERMEDGKVKDLYDRVWGGFSEYTESLKESEDGDDESFWSAAKKYKEENLTSDVDAHRLGHGSRRGGLYGW